LSYLDSGARISGGRQPWDVARNCGDVKSPLRTVGKNGGELAAPNLAAVDGGVADVLALDDVDDVFGDVGGVVADAFEIFGDEDELEGGEDDAAVAHHVGEEFAEDLVAVVIDLIVHGENFLCELDVAANDGVEGVTDHFFGDF